MQDDQLAYGELICSYSLEDMVTMFKEYLNCEIRFSSHFTNGTYFIVREKESTDISFEKINANEFLIHGESNSYDTMIEVCQHISSILTSHQLKHQIEISGAEENDICCFSYDWKKEA